MFATTVNAKTTFILEISWRECQPPVTVEISIPVEEDDEQTMNNDLDSVLDDVLDIFDDDDHQGLLDELRKCEDEVHALFSGLRPPQRLSEKATHLRESNLAVGMAASWSEMP